MQQIPVQVNEALQERDDNLTTAISHILIEELDTHILPCVIVPLSFKEAVTLEKSFNKNLTNIKLTDSQSFTIIESLNKRIDSLLLITQNPIGPNGKYFVKLSLLSPKDVVLQPNNKKTINNLRKQLDILWDATADEGRSKISIESTAVARALLQAFYDSMLVENHEIISLLLRSNRVHSELLESTLVEERYANTAIIIRPWVNIESGFEFRVFVNDLRITSISQYEAVYYPRVYAERFITKEKIVQFVNNHVINNLKNRLRSFIVDVVLVGDRFYVCELNPFSQSSGSCLFSWQIDRQQLHSGETQFRVVPPPNYPCNYEKRFVIVYKQIDDTVIEKIVDDGTDNKGLRLPLEWQIEIVNYWNFKLKKRNYLKLTKIAVVSLLAIGITYFTFKTLQNKNQYNKI